MLTSRHAIMSRDAVTKVVTHCGSFRVTTVTCSNVLREVINRHGLIEATNNHRNYLERMGQCIAFTNCLAATLQKEERIELKYSSAEATSTVESLALGECRARITNNNDYSLPNTLRLSRILYNNAEPVVSVTRMMPDEFASVLESNSPRLKLLGQRAPSDVLSIAEDYLDTDFTPHAANFMAKSEGSPESAVFLRAVVDTTSDTIFCCGAILHPIALTNANFSSSLGRSLLLSKLDPDVDQLLDQLIHESSRNGNLTQILLALMTGDDASAMASCVKTRQLVLDDPVQAAESTIRRVRRGLAGLEPATDSKAGRIELDSSTAEKTLVDFFCRCNKQDLMKHLNAMPKKDLAELKAQCGADGFVSTCAMCKRVHAICGEDWLQIEGS